MANIRDVAKAAAVSTATVSAVLNESAFVSDELRSKVLEAVARLNYTPKSAARALKRGKSQLLALVVPDLANAFYYPLVCAVEAVAEAWGYSVVVFNSDENPERERRILSRILSLSCEGVLMVPVSSTLRHSQRDHQGLMMPTVLFGRMLEEDRFDTVALDNVSAGRQVTDYLLDLGHRDIGTVTGSLHLTTSRGRLRGLTEAMAARGLAPNPDHVRSGEYREDVAYAVAMEMLSRPDRPTALYAANAVTAFGVLRALADLDLKCPDDLSLAITDPIPGVGGLRLSLTRTEHPVTDMANEAIRLLLDRIENGTDARPRKILFQPSLIVGGSCRPLAARKAIANEGAESQLRADGLAAAKR